MTDTAANADRHAPSETELGDALTRRRALGAAGALTLGAAAAVPRSAVAAASDPAKPGGPVGEAAAPANAVEFRARFVQSGASGQVFAAFGYLTRVNGLTDADLFYGNVHNETTALFTASAAGNLSERTLDQSVHSLDIDGELIVYHRSAPGASFAVPESFRSGVAVARFDLALQDILSVLLPGKGIPTLTGSMRQTTADPLLGAPPVRRFGRMNSEARLFATGVGTLVDPVTLNAVLEMAGNWVTA